MAGRNKGNKQQFDEVAWLEWRKGGKIQVYELARDNNRIRIRTGVKGKKFNSSVVTKDSAESARIFFEKQKRDKIRGGKFILVQRDNDKSGVRLPSLDPTPEPVPQKLEHAPKEEQFHFSFSAKRKDKENEVVYDNIELPKELDFEVELSEGDLEEEDDEDYSGEEDEDEDGDEEDEDDEDGDDDEEDPSEPSASPVRSIVSDGARRSVRGDGGGGRRKGNLSVPPSESGSHMSLGSYQTPSQRRKATAGSAASSASSSSSGRPSDAEYEMDYEQMADLMRRAIAKFTKDIAKQRAKFQWKRLKRWIRYDENGVEHDDKNARYHVVPLLNRIAGSCHELVVIRIKSSDGNIVTRLLKVARDPDEDNAHHFITERKVACRLSRIARVINRCYHTRTDVCVWPVETVCLEWNGQSDKWATVQAPFLPRKQTNYCFVKIEPNSGAPCVNDSVVGRYQHAFAAVSRGLDLVRDWQGYGVDAVCFADECKKYCPEALEQIRPRRGGPDQSTQVLVVIDPVLTTVTAHYETNNPTDFGMKAIDEWQSTHDCKRCRCAYFHLRDDLTFGLGDPDQTFLTEDAPQYLHRAFAGLRRELRIWCGDDDFDPAAYF